MARAFKEMESSAVSLAKLTFETICRRIGVPQRMTRDNDGRIHDGMFKTLWAEIIKAIGTKLSLTSSYTPQADPAERANRQVLEACKMFILNYFSS